MKKSNYFIHFLICSYLYDNVNIIKISKNMNNNEFLISENEAEVISFWQKNKIFEKSVLKGEKGSFVFYDGPPFATGTPHYGHLAGSIIKDVIPRYYTMRGYQVERKWGWDCHGLPIENIVEKELGTKTKKDIEEFGVDKFNDLCRQRVSTFIEEWKTVITRIGRFADMENAYRTMDLPFMESIWWAFKNLWDKGLVYKDNRSMHVCPRCQTTLAQSEVSEGYKDIKDLSVIAKFKLKEDDNISDNTYILAWTTTPWTLIGNVALVVGADIDYVLVELNEEKLILAKSVFENEKTSFKQKLEGAKVIEEFKGSKLIGLSYEPLYDYYSSDEKLINRDNGWKIYAADFVDTNEGVGVVHIAPAFGEDDMKVAKENKLPFVQHVGMDGVFKEEVNDFPSLNVKPLDNHSATDIEIIKSLAAKELLFHKEKYEHSYPHCWRCDTPLINYATSSWFVSVDKLKPRLLETAKNINWSPKYIKEGRFGNWLEGARDWSISRQRFWASCIPIWDCACGARKVIGSVSELEELSGEKITDIHKDKIDHILIPCPDCGGKMKRIADVLDCWFESGAMPYAQHHYPFENKEKVENNFPADFIAEGVDQTRTWFYYLHVVSGGINDSEAAKNITCNGIVLAEDGKKMSKKLQNYPNPIEILDKYGADALRSYLLSSPVLMGENLNFSETGVQESLRKNVMLLINVFKFYDMFSEEIDKDNNIISDNVLDIWISARLKQLTRAINIAIDANHNDNTSKEVNLPKAMRQITEFIDELSTWYIRRSRDRFKSDDNQDKQKAIQTTKQILTELSKLIAPFLPFVSEGLWQRLNKEDFSTENSIHLQSWPEERELNKEEQEVIEKMALVREIVSLGLAKRDEYKIKIRQMLNPATVYVKDEKDVSILDEKYLQIASDELNLVSLDIKHDKEKVVNEQRFNLELDTVISPELKKEGIKREIVRSINMIRKDEGLSRDISAKVILVTRDEDITDVIKSMNEEIKKETVSESIEIQEELNNEDETMKIKELKINSILITVVVLR